jgi:hypothetical protein
MVLITDGVLNAIGVIVCLALFVVAAVALIVAIGIQKWRGRAIATCGAALLTLAGAITQTSSGWRHSEDAQINQPAMTAAVVDPGGSVPMCRTFDGTANLADGYGLAIGTRREGNNRWYFESAVDVSEDGREWTARVTLGEPAEGSPAQYVIRPVILSDEWLRYLRSTQEDPKNTYWSSGELPPGSVSGTDLTVTRTDNKRC